MTTPTRTAIPYRVVLPASADRAAWLTTRRQGIGSSDVAAVMGVSSHGSAQHVFYDKRGVLPLEDDAGEPALWGTLLEETVAREWARRNRSVVRRVGLIARKDAPHRICTLDRLSTECPLNREIRERCAVEVKTRNAFVAGKWKRSIPDDVLAQVLWQLHVTGYDHIHVACLIGGQDYRQYVIRRADHDDLIGDIVTVADRLWADIQTGRIPVLTGDEPADTMFDLYNQLHPDRQGITYLDRLPNHGAVAAIENLFAYEDARLREKAAKAQKVAAKVALVEALGGGLVAIAGQDIAYELKPVERSACDLDRLAEEFPDAYAACVTQKTSLTFTVAQAYRQTEPLT